MPWTAVLLVLLSPSPARAADTCVIEATEWRQDGTLRASAEGPVFARATASPELLAVEVELVPGEAAARVRVHDSVGQIEAWMPLSELRVRVDQPLRFADDTLYLGQADLAVQELDGGGVRVTPFELPSWLRAQDRLAVTLPCATLGLVESWRGDLRTAAVGQAPRGERVFLSADDTVPVSRVPGTSAAVRLLLEAPLPVEQLSTEVSAVRVLAPLPGMMLVGWVPKESLAQGGAGGGSPEPEVAEEPPAAEVPPLVRCKKELPLWASTEGGEFQLGTLAAGVRVALGEKVGDRLPVLAIPDASAWVPVPGVGLSVSDKDAKGCKAAE
ncbi:MAG: hypothetical protein ABIO70_36830 [Pseudomonadota bacterium]